MYYKEKIIIKVNIKNEIYFKIFFFTKITFMVNTKEL